MHYNIPMLKQGTMLPFPMALDLNKVSLGLHMYTDSSCKESRFFFFFFTFMMCKGKRTEQVAEVGRKEGPVLA